jgi:SAM-dependent methyltransferase
VTQNIDTDLSFTQDAIDPFDVNNPNLWVKLEHLGRYLFATDYLRRYQPNRVGDLACGLGYGLVELSQIAHTVIAVDCHSDVLTTAPQARLKERFPASGTLEVYQHDLEVLPWPKSLCQPPLDAIVSFETLEHVLEPERVLAQFAQVLADRGICICSVPNVIHDPPGVAGLPVNPDHRQFFDFHSLRRLLERSGFKIIDRVGQASSNLLYKRESQLLKRRSLQQRLGDFAVVHHPDVIRHLAYLLAYPTAMDVEGSYSLIVVAQKI